MLNSNFIQAWREWLRQPVPATSFRNGHTDSPKYELEHDIDHSVSYVQGLVRNLIAGKELDYERLAAAELVQVEQLIAKLNRCELSLEEKQKFKSYLSRMTFILKQIAERRSTTQ